jgi:hypothetical protein
VNCSSLTHIVGIGRQVVVALDCGLPLTFDRTHLSRVVVVVRERPIDIGQVEIVAIGNRSRGEPSFFDLFLEAQNSNPSAFEMRPVVEFLHDTSRRLAHTARSAAIVPERLDWILARVYFHRAY